MSDVEAQNRRRLGRGAALNGRPIRPSSALRLDQGLLGTGFSNRREMKNIVGLIDELFDEGGVFYRNASGALMLAYVAAGRLLGYVEEHMNAWDCLAGMLLIEEAGGKIVPPDPHTVLERGTVVVASCPGVFERVQALCARSNIPRFSAVPAHVQRSPARRLARHRPADRRLA